MNKRHASGRTNRRRGRRSGGFTLLVGQSVAYRVVISSRKLIDGQGNELDGWCDPDRREIVFAPDLPPARRMRCLRHEFWHAWVNHNPRPTDEEAEAMMFEHVGEEFQAQVDKQGGASGLMAMGFGSMRRKRENNG